MRPRRPDAIFRDPLADLRAMKGVPTPSGSCRIDGQVHIDGERQGGNMAKGNNAQKKETKKPKKGAVKGGADSKPKDNKKK